MPSDLNVLLFACNSGILLKKGCSGGHHTEPTSREGLLFRTFVLRTAVVSTTSINLTISLDALHHTQIEPIRNR